MTSIPVQHIDMATCLKTVILSAFGFPLFFIVWFSFVKFRFVRIFFNLTTPLLLSNNTLELPKFELELIFNKNNKGHFY